MKLHLNARRDPAFDRKALARSARTILSVLGWTDAELSISLVDDAGIARLAGDYGRRRRATDVLSFPAAEGPGAEFAGRLVGDVVISLDTAKRQAAARRVPLERNEARRPADPSCLRAGHGPPARGRPRLLPALGLERLCFVEGLSAALRWRLARPVRARRWRLAFPFRAQASCASTGRVAGSLLAPLAALLRDLAPRGVQLDVLSSWLGYRPA
jgi:ssRNA-specific RNase YbeY (16S rRNA maturation enzyme)